MEKDKFGNQSGQDKSSKAQSSSSDIPTGNIPTGNPSKHEQERMGGEGTGHKSESRQFGEDNPQSESQRFGERSTKESESRQFDTDTETAEKPLLTAMFKDRESAEKAYHSLLERGYSDDEISLMMSEETRKKHYSDSEGQASDQMESKAAEGAGKGSAIGGTVGAIAGVIAAVGTTVAIPGLGIVVAGPIAAGLAGAGAGGIAGGLVGGLVGMGIPKEQAEKYKEGIEEGYTFLAVHPRNKADADYLEQNWRSHNAVEVHR